MVLLLLLLTWWKMKSMLVVQLHVQVWFHSFLKQCESDLEENRKGKLLTIDDNFC